MRATATTPKVRVTCDCKVCDGKAALVPETTLAEASGKTAIHNYVSLAHHMPSVAFPIVKD